MGKRIIRWSRYKFLKILRLKDGSDRIAKGVALGIAFNFLPTFGLGLICAFLTAGLVKANQMAAVLSAILVKFGIPIFYILNLAMGHLILGQGLTVEGGTVPHLSLGEFDWVSIKQLGWPFLVGSVVNAIWTGILAYFLVFRMVERYRNGKLRKARVR